MWFELQKKFSNPHTKRHELVNTVQYDLADFHGQLVFFLTPLLLINKSFSKCKKIYRIHKYKSCASFYKKQNYNFT